MAHNRDYKPEDIAFPDQVITESELAGEMQTSYIDYAMSVIVGRALPDSSWKKRAAKDRMAPIKPQWVLGRKRRMTPVTKHPMLTSNPWKEQ